MTIGKWQSCPICKEYGFSDTHRCPPIFWVRDADISEERLMIYARDAEQAAERYCAKVDVEDCEWRSHDVLVRDDKNDEDHIYSVDMETVPQYYAHKPYHEIKIVEDVKEEESEE